MKQDETNTITHGVVLWKVLQVTGLHSCKVVSLTEILVLILAVVDVDTSLKTRTRAGRMVTDIAVVEKLWKWLSIVGVTGYAPT